MLARIHGISHRVAGIAIMAMIAAIASVGDARAAVTFQYVAAQSNYSVAPGATVNVNVFLRETLGAQGDISILTSQNGIFGFDVHVAVTGGNGAIFNALGNLADFTDPLGVNYQYASDPTPSGTSAVDLATSALDDPGLEGTVNGNTRSILLGTFMVGAGSLPNSTGTFGITDSTFFGSNTITNSNTTLDTSINNGSFTVTTANSPEPAVLSLLGAACLLTMRRRRSHTSRVAG